MAEKLTSENAWRLVTVRDPRTRALLDAYCEIAGAVLNAPGDFSGITDELDAALRNWAELVDVFQDPALLQLHQLASTWTDTTEGTNNDY
jgi:hypothetical protein